MNAAIHSALADSGLHLVGNKVIQFMTFQPLPAGQDDDAHVEAFEEWTYSAYEWDCMCCCCTGECRDQGYDDPSFEDVLSAGFVEGDLEPTGCPCMDLLEGWSSCENCLPGCKYYMGAHASSARCF